MNLSQLRTIFTPLFGVDRRESVSRLLYSIIWASVAIDLIVLVIDVAEGGLSFDPRTNVLIGLFAFQIIPLRFLQRGDVYPAALSYLTSFWLAMTYHAWNGGGVHDSAILVYMTIVLIAALLTNWRVSIFFAALSILAIWVMAVAELRGDLVSQAASTFQRARDLTAIFIFLIVLVLLVINVLRDALEKVRGDFAGRLQAEQALREGEERFRRIFQASPIAISLTSLDDGRLLDANDAYWRLTGFSPQFAIGRTTVELGIWKDEARRQKFVARLLEQKTLHNPVYEFPREGGEKRTTTAYYELIEFGNKPAILSLFHDITDQKQTQDALLRSEARMRAMLEAMPDMIFELTRGGTILQFVPSALAEPLYPAEEFLGKKVAEVIPSIAEQTAFAIERALESGQVSAYEYQLSQHGEEKTFEARIVSIGADTVMAMIRDVSLIKWISAEREKLINELEAKNAELEQFTYTVSHDLKAPIITIRGFLGFLSQDARSGNLERLENDIFRIGEAADKMHNLLNDLLDLSRIGRVMNPPVEVDLGELIASAQEILQGRMQERGVKVVVKEPLPTVYGDRQRLLEVVQNLLDNAAKFMGEQPQPGIVVGQVDAANDGYATLYVSDNGVGIAPQYHERIFGLFNRLNPNIEGTGVGLALVKRIVEFHGGRVWVESEAGQGAAFYFTLPLPPSSEVSEDPNLP